MRGNYLVYALSLIGFVSVVGQVFLLREFMTVFHGNELSLGLILANWLLLVSFGSYLSGLLSERFKLGIKTFIVLQMLVSLTLPVQLYSIGAVRHLLGITLGELVGLTQILASSLLILAPLCIALGFQFTLGCKIYAEKTGKKAAGIGWVYVLEALGSLAGGVFFSYLLVLYLNPFQTVFLVAVLILISSLFLLRMENLFKSNLALSACLLLTLAIFSFLNASLFMESYNRLYWGDDLISSENSIYGNIVVLERGGQYSFYENGLLMYTTGDTGFNEELIHFPMLEHPKPGKVLLVGGGAGGALKEILKHPIGKVTYVELDPKVIEVSKRHIPEEDLEALNDSRVEVVTADGRFFIKESRERYDVVVVNLPEPSTAQLNRFYTQEFFEENWRVLDDDGILSIGIPSSESYVGGEERILGGSIYKTMKTFFPDLIVIPGEKSFLLASKNKSILSYNPEILSKRLADRGVETELLDGSYIGYKLSGDRIDFTLNSLNEEDVQVNTDLRPIGYYYYTLLWSSLTNPEFRSLFNTRSIVSISLLALLIPLVIWRMHRRLLIPSAIFTVGLTGMAYEVVSMIAFQALYGFLYYKMAIIIAAFMAGLALGGFYMNKIMGDKGERFFAKIELSIALYSLMLPFIFIEISKSSGLLSSPEIFPLLMVVAGFLIGLEFPLANKLYLLREKRIAKTAGIVYASDLLGACFGAFFSSAILIPLIGVVNLCILLAVLNLVMGLIVFCLR